MAALRRLAAPLAILALLAACTPPPASPPPRTPSVQPVRREPVRPPAPPVLPLLLPLSGPAAPLGRDLLDAATLALFDGPESELRLVPLDTGGDARRAREAAQRAFAGERARIVLGPLFATSTRAVTPLARARGALVLSLSNDRTAAAPPAVHVLGFTPEEQVRRILRHAVDAGHRRIAALVPDDAYGRRALAAFRRTLARLGLPADLVLVYDEGGGTLAQDLRAFTDYDARREALQARIEELQRRDDPEARAELAELRTKDTLGPPPFDAVLVADGGERLRSVLALLRYFDAGAGSVRLLGTMRWLDPGGKFPAFRPELAGARLPLPDPALREAFAVRFSATFGREPDLLAALAYDVVREAVEMLQGGRLEPERFRARGGWNGVLGPVRLLPDGTLAHALAVYELGPEGPQPVEPPPAAPAAGAGRSRSGEAALAAGGWYDFPLLPAGTASRGHVPLPRRERGPSAPTRGTGDREFQ